MPYEGAGDKDLPENVKKLSEKKRKQWVAVFNSAMAKGLSEEDCFKQANGAIKAKGFVELWDVDARQLPASKCNYNALGAKDNKGCASCNWFVSPDSCVLVRGDISPTGLCDMHMDEIEYEPEPLMVKVVEEEKEVSPTMFEKLVERIKEFFASQPLLAGATSQPVQGEKETKEIIRPFIFIKQGEDIRFFTTFTNCLWDKHNEVILTSAHKEYVKWVEKTNYFPELHLWHAGFKSKWGKVDWIDFVDGFVCTSGIIDRDKQHIVEALEGQDIVVSHGFVGLTNSKGEIFRYRTFEISPLPTGAAANVWTNFLINKESEMPFSDKKRQWLKETAGVSDEVIKTWEESVDGLVTHAKSLGLEFKEEEEKEESIALEVSKLTKAVSDLMGVVDSDHKVISSLQKDWDEKIHEAFVAEIAKSNKGYSATEDDKTVVEKKESDANLSWFGELIKSEGK